MRQLSLRRFYPPRAFARTPILRVQKMLQIIYLRVYFGRGNSSVKCLPLRFIKKFDFGIGDQ